jgi:hypothetical protein
MAQLFSNNGISSLASGITAGATSMTFATGEGVEFNAPTGGDFELLTLYDGATIDISANVEIVKMTARTADVATIVRAQEGTTGFAFSSADGIEATATALTLSDLSQGKGGLFQDVTEKVHATGGPAIDPANGNVQVVTLTQNETLTFANLSIGQVVDLTLVPGAFAFTLTNIAAWDNDGAAPSSISARHRIIVSNVDGTIEGTNRGGVS